MTHPALFIVGHGTRDAAGVAEFHRFVDVVRAEAGDLHVRGGFIELAEPDLDTAIDDLVGSGAAEAGVVAVPLVLLGAGHMKNDGPGALARARRRHPGVPMTYGRELGVHPTVLALAEARAREAMAATAPADHAVVLVGRGSSDPDANSDLYKACRLVWDHRQLGLVEPAFISLAPPGVSEAHGPLPPPRCHHDHRRAVLPVRRRPPRPHRARGSSVGRRPPRCRRARRAPLRSRCPSWPAS